MKLTGYTISEFASLVSGPEVKSTNNTIYGTIVMVDEKMYVKIDGSDLLTPATTETDVKDGDRVSVSIQNHSAVVSGNVTDPSASVGRVEDNYSEFVIEKDLIYAKVANINGDIAELSIRADEISTRVENAEGSISSITQRADELDLTVSAKADSATIISTINMSREGIKISSDKINIEGFVTFTDLSTPGETTISGSNITSGQITGTTLRTATLTETTGVAIETDSVKIGSASLWFQSSRFEVQCKKNIAIGSMGTITIMPGLNQDGSSTGNGTVSIPEALLNVQKLKVINNTTIQGTCAVSGAFSCANISAAGSCAATGGFSATNGGVYVTGAITTTGGSINASNGTVTASALKSTGNMNCVDAGVSGNISVSGTAWIKTLYVNGTAVTSDRRLKTDIRYVDSDIQTLGDSGWIAPNVNINKNDMLEFIEALPIASYRYKEDVEKGRDKTHYGFIIQDVLYTKVGSELVTVLDEDKQVGDEDDYMGYSPEKLMVFMCGALQEEIKARKALEEIVRNK